MDTNVNPQRQKTIAMLVMILTAVMWSTGGFLVKMVPWNPLFIAGMRSFFSAGVVFLMMKATKTPLRINKYVVGAAIGLVITFFGFVSANKLTTAANAIMLQYDAPIAILVINSVFLHKPFVKKQGIAVGLAALGIVLFFMDQLTPGGMLGNCVAIISGFAFATFMVCVAEGGEDDSTRYSGIFFGHILTALLGIPTAIVSPPTAELTPWIAIVVLGIFQLGIPYVLVGVAAKHVSALSISMLSMIEPILNPIWVALLVGEIPGTFALIGGAIIVGTVTWWCVSEAKASPEPET